MAAEQFGILPIYVIPQSDQKYQVEDSSIDISFVLSCDVGAVN